MNPKICNTLGDTKTDHDNIEKGIKLFYEDYPEAKT